MDVGIRDLKARLSEYVERAANGERIRVTDRGRLKAILGPVPGKPRLDEGIAEGWVTPAKGRVPQGPRRRFKGRRSVQEMLDDDRFE